MDFIDITRRWHLWNRRNLRTQISIWEYDGGHMCRFEDFTLVMVDQRRVLWEELKLFSINFSVGRLENAIDNASVKVRNLVPQLVIDRQVGDFLFQMLLKQLFFEAFSYLATKQIEIEYQKDWHEDGQPDQPYCDGLLDLSSTQSPVNQNSLLPDNSPDKPVWKRS